MSVASNSTLSSYSMITSDVWPQSRGWLRVGSALDSERCIKSLDSLSYRLLHQLIISRVPVPHRLVVETFPAAIPLTMASLNIINTNPYVEDRLFPDLLSQSSTKTDTWSHPFTEEGLLPLRLQTVRTVEIRPLVRRRPQTWKKWFHWKTCLRRLVAEEVVPNQRTDYRIIWLRTTNAIEFEVVLWIPLKVNESTA